MISRTALAVIPVRLAASRLPRKPLLLLGGRPIVQWVWEATVASGVFAEVVIATPDEEIARAASGFGAEVRLTRPDHLSGTDRVAEAAAGSVHPIVANVQGDQPFVTPEMLAVLVSSFDTDPEPDMTTIAVTLHDQRLLHDPDTVKVVLDDRSRALYFSRAPIPFPHTGRVVPWLHHLGLYAFRRDFLDRFSELEPGPLEVTEGLEQLRALEHGFQIRVGSVTTPTLEINTPADLAQAARLLTGEQPR